MSAAAVLAIVVAAGEAQTPTGQAMSAATTEALGGRPPVALFETAALSDAEALRIETSAGALAAAQVIWQDDARLQVTIRLHVPRTDRWVDRSIAFDRSDNLLERGRTVGFAIGSMLPEADPTLRPTFSDDDGLPSPAGAAAQHHHFAGLSLMGGGDFQGVARGFGGALEVALSVSETVLLRLSAGLRGGTITSVAATGVNAYAGVGAAWSPWPSRANRRVTLSLRADALLILQEVQHARSGGASEWKGAALPGADALVEVGWRLGGDLHAVVAAGIEAAFGTVDVSVVSATHTETAIIPALRAVGQAGLRLYF